ncbi:hypothetical protein GQ457_01G014270 [Hibiscus cannabinus]
MVPSGGSKLSTTKTLAANSAPHFSIDLGFSQIVLEGDSSSIIGKLQALDPDFFEISSYINDRKGLTNDFRKCQSVSVTVMQIKQHIILQR